MTRFLIALAFAAAAICASPATAQTASCTKFREAMARASGDLRVEFVRPLVVSRGRGEGLEQFDLVSKARIDGSLHCRAEVFVRFEATVHLPADSGLIEHHTNVQSAALEAALGWSHARAREKVRAASADAAEFLRGSAERGDFEIAGKLEEHLPGGVDFGAVWTPTERTFLLLQGD